jgi:putative ABC transport system substrate-binding protein
VRSRVALIVATGGPTPALAAKAATSNIPIVIAFGSDPVELGLVRSLNRPGGNITGATSLVRELYAKRFELLHGIVPTAALIGFLDNPTGRQVQTRNQEVEMAARTLGVRLVTLNASTSTEIDAAFKTAAKLQISALLIGGDPLFAMLGSQIVELAAHYSVPAIYAYPDTAEGGGLMSYGSPPFETPRIAGRYAGRILNGELPANLPFEQTTKVELVINLKTAKALGLTIPETLLATADEVIQ